MFEMILTARARKQWEDLKADRGLEKRLRAVRKTLCFLSENPRHPSLRTREFTSLKGPQGEKVFEAYAEQSTSAAYRVFWYDGPQENQITVIALTLHP